ncbi:glycosyltransferase family 2 protein [Rhodopseudomonas palustris]|uniref:Glycosyltransferase family 2 protein n=1 Tax=Rhodopseudomonas palustris TaxID=1076 RepID=A0AAX3DWX7_RHOPL|nr:glycosyltransferase family 2 protein [Rhodopseudomonas palustris]UYO38492.1 glycosyltransferase family 2 protein [Rhodopseudomonas palustris]
MSLDNQITLMMVRSSMAANHWPLVAVVTPVYNGDAFLDLVMSCVQQQTYENVIHVVVDNCSSDATPEIIDRYRFGRVPLHVVRNSAVLPLRENWKAALSAVPDDAIFIKILCADDLISSDCIERMVDATIRDDSVTVVMCHDVFANEVRRANLPDQLCFEGMIVAAKMMDESINWLPYHHMFIRNPDPAQRAALFDDVPIHFDLSAVVKVALTGKMAYIRDVLVYTRWHPGSLTSQQLGPEKLGPLVERYDILCKFGPRCWDYVELEKRKADHRARLIRFALSRIVVGDVTTTRKLIDEFAKRKVRICYHELVVSIAKWYAYLKWKRSWSLPHGPQMTEDEFVQMSLGRMRDALMDSSQNAAVT